MCLLFCFWKSQEFNGVFQASVRNWLNCVHNCDDHSLRNIFFVIPYWHFSSWNQCINNLTIHTIIIAWGICSYNVEIKLLQGRNYMSINLCQALTFHKNCIVGLQIKMVSLAIQWVPGHLEQFSALLQMRITTDFSLQEVHFWTYLQVSQHFQGGMLELICGGMWDFTWENVH